MAVEVISKAMLSYQLNAGVLVINHMVGGSGGGPGSGPGSGAAAGGVSNRNAVAAFDSEFKRPALGESWNHQCHCRVQLTRPATEGQPWTAIVRASTMLTPGKMVAQYWIGAGGASAASSTLVGQQQ